VFDRLGAIAVALVLCGCIPVQGQTRPTGSCMLAVFYSENTDGSQRTWTVVGRTMYSAQRQHSEIRSAAFYGSGEGRLAVELAASCPEATSIMRSIFLNAADMEQDAAIKAELTTMSASWVPITRTQYEDGPVRTD
jgi:hypothetical protein